MSENSTIEYPIELTIKIGPKRWWRPRTTIFQVTNELEFPVTSTPTEELGVMDVHVDYVQPVTDFLLDSADDWESATRE